MPSLRRLLLLASAIVFVDTMFYAAVAPLLPTFAEEFSLSKSAAGVLAGSYAAGTMVGALPGGWLAARAGVRPTVLVGLLLMSVSSLVFAFGSTVVVLELARFVQGVGGAASWAGALAWLVTCGPRERRGELIGTAIGAAIAGSLFGPVVGGAAEVSSRGLVFSAVAALGAGLALWAATTGTVRPEASSRMSELGTALLDRRVASGTWLIVLPGLLVGTLGVLAPLRLDELGVTPLAIAGVFVAATALEAMVSPIVGRISDRRGRLLPSLVGLVIAAGFIALLPWPTTGWLLIAVVIGAAPAVGVLWAPASAMLSDGAEVRGLDQGLAFALMNLAWAVGQVSGSLGGARIGQDLGDVTAYSLLAAMCLATVAVLYRGLRRWQVSVAVKA